MCDPSLQLGLVIEMPNDPLHDLGEIEIQIGLHGDIDLSPLAVETSKPGQAVEGLPDRIQSRERNLERAFFLRLLTIWSIRARRSK